MKQNDLLKRIIVLALFAFLSLGIMGCQLASFPTNEIPEITNVGSFENYNSLKDYISQYYSSNSGAGDYYLMNEVDSPSGVERDGVMTTTTINSSATFDADDNVEFSQTNNQVDGVSESDRILTDGHYIYVTTNSNFYMINAESLEIINQMSFSNGYLIGMYLTDHSVVLISTEYNYVEDDTNETENDIVRYYNYDFGVRVNVYSTFNPENLELTKSLYFSKSGIVSSRVIDNTLYLVMDNYQLGYRFEDNNFIPTYKDSAIGEEWVNIPANQIYYMPNDTSSLSFLVLASVKLDSDEAANVSAYLGSSYQIYMSLNNLYTTVYRYYYDETLRTNYQKTYILRFEIEDHQLVYKAYAEIYGMPLNQYSMDEYKGVFRIATTSYDWRNEESSTTNQLFLLDATSTDTLTLLSILPDLGKPNERIYAVRYTGDTAYVVTFVNTDPMYKLDLTDPENPAILGELYEEGVSDYLHPVGETLMIGIGRQAETNPYGSTYFVGVKVSLYDISLDNPITLETYLVDGEYSYSPVTYDSKAFVYYQPSGLDYMYVVIPVSEYVIIHTADEDYDYDYYGYSQNAYVFKVYYAGDLEFVTKLSHYNPDSTDHWYRYFDTIDRSVMIGDKIYTVSYSKVQMYDMSNNFELLHSVQLEEDYYWYYYGSGIWID